MAVAEERGQAPVAHGPNGDGLYRQERQERQERPETANSRGTATSRFVTSLAFLAVSVVAARRRMSRLHAAAVVILRRIDETCGRAAIPVE
jgi:hypothetical protein